MKNFIVKFTEQFWGGLLVGSLLTGLLVSTLAFERIEKHRAFENELIESFFAAIKDVETLQKVCGDKCQDITLTYPETRKKMKRNSK